MKYVIFDLDGTLLDSMAVWNDMDIRFLNRYGKTPTEELRNRVKTLSIRQSAEMFKSLFDLTQSIEDILAEITQMGMEEYALNVQLKPFVVDFLRHLDRNQTKMCIATAAPRENVEPALSRLGIQKFFDFIMAAEDVQTGKDHPEIYLKCCERFGAAPAEVTVFEDSLHAVRTAKDAGFRVIGVQDDYSSLDTVEIKKASDFYISHFGELMEKMEGMD